MKLLTCNGDLVEPHFGGEYLTYAPGCNGTWELIDAAEIVYEVSFSPELFSYGFMGVLSIWGIGLGTGLIVGQIRKIRG